MMKLFLPLFSTHTKHQKELVKDFCEIKKEIHSHVRAYMKSQEKLVVLVYAGTRQQIKAQQTQVETERRKLSLLLKQREKMRSLLAYVY